MISSGVDLELAPLSAQANVIYNWRDELDKWLPKGSLASGSELTRKTVGKGFLADNFVRDYQK